jgi:2-hydroxychromene-2-carboxylate isomerase
MSTQVEFFYDVVSPYSYMAATQIEAIAADCDAHVVWRPMLLGGLFNAVGNQAPALLPPRGRYLFKDLARWGAHYGVPVRMPTPFPTRTLTAMRALVAMAPEERPEPSLALFRAYWAEGRDIGDDTVVAEIIGEAAVARAADPEVKKALIDATVEAESRGAFGAPTFYVGDEMYFGNDRLPFLEQELRRVRASRG